MLHSDLTPLCVSGLGRACARFHAPYRHGGRIKVYQAADLSTLLLRPACFHPASCTSAITSFRRWSWSLCLAQLTPAYGVTSMPFLPGCHRPFSRSSVRRSVADACRGLALFFLLICAFYVHVRHPRSSLLQHVITSSVFTLRPFALYLTSWRVLGYVEGAVLETAAHLSSFRESPLCAMVGQTFSLF